MNQVITKVNAGVCGFITEISATSDDQQIVSFDAQTQCDNIKRLIGLIETVDAYSELGLGYDGLILTATRQALRGCCSACVVPNGIFKAMQVAAKVALPKNITMSFEVEESI